MRTIFTIAIIGWLFYSCTEQGENSDNGSEVEESTVVEEGAAIDQWINELYNNPVNQREMDQNSIINYIIDEGLDMKKTGSGLFYQILQEGEGPTAEWGDRVAVHYKGYYLNGEEFDSSFDRSEAMKMYVGNAIPGWNEGLQLLNEGSKAMFIVPSHLAYGEEGRGQIPANKILAFELQLMNIID